jgi:ferritin-like metal-binding protein YciE
MTLRTLEDLLLRELQDLRSSEVHLSKLLPRLAEAASSFQLSELIGAQLLETELQLNRLDTILDELAERPTGDECGAVKCLADDCEQILDEGANPQVLDAALIAVTQRFKNFEIAVYGSAWMIAQELGYSEIAGKLRLSLEEEETANTKLQHLALSGISHKSARN